MNSQTVQTQFAIRGTSGESRTEQSGKSAKPRPADARLAITLARENVLGLLIAAARLESVPASAWPVEAALEQLGIRLTSHGALSRAVARWQEPGDAVRSRFPGLSETLRGLVGAGHLRPTGRGSHAALVVSSSWQRLHEDLMAALTPEERTVLIRVAQRLVALATTASNRLSITAPCNSGEMASSVTRRQALIR